MRLNRGGERKGVRGTDASVEGKRYVYLRNKKICMIEMRGGIVRMNRGNECENKNEEPEYWKT